MSEEALDQYLDGLEPSGMTVNEEVSIHLKQLSDLTGQLEYILERKKALESQLQRLKELSIPQVLQKHGMRSLQMLDGTKVQVEEELTATLIKDSERRKIGLEWLQNNGGEDLIKDCITILDPTDVLKEYLSSHGVLYDMSKDVNANSLKAWLREKLGLKEGIVATIEANQVPAELGLYIRDVAKVTVPKRR